MSTPDLRARKTTAEPTSQQKTWHCGTWKTATSHMSFRFLPAQRNRTREWMMDADCLKFTKAEISKTWGQKDYGTVNCWPKSVYRGHSGGTQETTMVTQKPSVSCPSRYKEWSKPDHFGTHIWVFVTGGYGCMSTETTGEICYIFLNKHHLLPWDLTVSFVTLST